ncbi:hypothetical protein EVA_02569 [gut metagenome]|uniref:Uncharacterized protein n=1 Tax=gut metagenome TaxID=749906 RepID=J9H5R0_9ZZZZ
MTFKFLFGLLQLNLRLIDLLSVKRLKCCYDCSSKLLFNFHIVIVILIWIN